MRFFEAFTDNKMDSYLTMRSALKDLEMTVKISVRKLDPNATLDREILCSRSFLN